MKINKEKLIYEEEKGRFYFADFFTFTDEIEKAGKLKEYQVDHIITDPPYDNALK